MLSAFGEFEIGSFQAEVTAGGGFHQNLTARAFTRMVYNLRGEQWGRVTYRDAAAQSAGSPETSSWSFSERDPLAGAATTHTYAIGTHTAKVRVTDDDGAIGLTAVQFSIVNLTRLYVDAAAGNDGNDGSSSSPFQTIGKAMSEAAAPICPDSVVVFVAEGAYPESLTFATGRSGGKTPPCPEVKIRSPTLTEVSRGRKRSLRKASFCPAAIASAPVRSTRTGTRLFKSVINRTRLVQRPTWITRPRRPPSSTAG